MAILYVLFKELKTLSILPISRAVATGGVTRLCWKNDSTLRKITGCMTLLFWPSWSTAHTSQHTCPCMSPVNIPAHACLGSVSSLKLCSKTKVCNTADQILLDQDIFALDISMSNTRFVPVHFWVKVCKPTRYTCSYFAEVIPGNYILLKIIRQWPLFVVLCYQPILKLAFNLGLCCDKLKMLSWFRLQLV